MMSLEVVHDDDALLLSANSNIKNWWQKGDDLFLHTATKEQESQRQQRRLLYCLAAAATIGLMLSISGLAVAGIARQQASTAATVASLTEQQLTTSTWPLIRRIAFSSCTSYDLRPQPIWTQGVIPSQPDAWIWLGDITYMDDPLLDCSQVPTFPQCNCSADYMRHPPFQCFAGDVQHARTRMLHQLSIPEYQEFLSYMCPGYEQTGVFPPQGTNPRMCPKPIFGVYDDHDSGWNNGNGRNPSKHEIKNMYLDGIGEAQDSPRRSSANGLQTSYTLPGPGSSSRESDQGGLRDEINLVLLDERYFRETLPCSAREDWCASILASSSTAAAGDVAFCHDYLIEGGLGIGGSCCRKDDEWGLWCTKAASRHQLNWRQLCDPTTDTFAQQLVVLDTDNTTVLPLSGDLWTNRQQQLASRLLEATTSPICEVLGLQQRQWLQEIMQSSKAALNVIASGSVLAGSVGWMEGDGRACSGDDLLCWPRAQVNLLHTIANASGCTVVIVGDFHYSDLKVIQPGANTQYAQQLQTHHLKKPVYQVMGSGMTYSTAEHQGPKQKCEGSFREDVVGLRPLGNCSYVPDPGFSMLEVDWEERIVSLSVRNHTTGGVAIGYDGRQQLVRFSLNSCERI